jgi:hypothetical protein
MTVALTKTFLALNQKPPGDEGLITKALVFCEDLDDIPTEELDYCFRQARISRADSFFPSTGEIVAEWGHRQAEIVRLREKEEKQSLQLPEPAPLDMAKDCTEYMLRPTPEKLENLRNKYPNAGF